MSVTVSKELARKKEINYRFNSPCCGNCKNFEAIGLLQYSFGKCDINDFKADYSASCDLYIRKDHYEV